MGGPLAGDLDRPPGTLRDTGRGADAAQMHARVLRSARNNALWCDAVCRAHGMGGELADVIWTHARATPRFYPNAITLADARAAAGQRAAVRALAATGIPGEWAVKDSFAALDLEALGFRVLFDARWIWRAASAPPPDAASRDVRWERLERPRDLAAWEAAWSGEPAERTAGGAARIFAPSLVANDDVAILAARRADRIVAGAIANRGADVVGLSNLFARGPDSEGLRAGCLARAIEAFPGLPVVGYEPESGLAAAQALGFEPSGPLRVWVRALGRGAASGGLPFHGRGC